MVKLLPEFQKSATGMKDTFARVLIDMADQDSRVVYLDADLANPAGMLTTYGKAHPDRFIDCGIMEANMVGTATGLSAAGMVPFAHSFSCFIGRQALDSIFLTGGFAQQNVKLIGSDPGITAEQNGASHAGMEDFGILKNIPGITLIDPCDPVEFEAVLRLSKEQYGMFYIRYNRKAVPVIYDASSSFDLSKGNLLREGTDVTLIASGIMVHEALVAADMLKQQGISAAVADIFTWKPLDEELICRCAAKTGAMAIHTSAVSQIGFVVRDLESVVIKWEKLLGKPVDRYSLTPAGQKKYYGQEEDFCARIAIFHLNNVDLEFIQPLRGPSIWQDFLDKNGGGIHHVQFLCDRFTQDSSTLAEQFGPMLQVGPSVRGPDYHFAYFGTDEDMGCSIEILNSLEHLPED